VRLIVVSVYILCCHAGFQVLRDFSTPDCFVVCLGLIRVGVLVRACAYMYWSNLHVYVYILQVYTHGVDMCVDRCYTRSSHVSGHIFIYIHAGFTCIYLRICAQSSHVWVYIYVYTPKVYMCMCIYYVYTHRVHMCVCILLRIYTHRQGVMVII